MGERAPMLPTMPKASARTLCTAPMTAPQPAWGMNAAAITRNIREKTVPMPPGMCSASVMRLAAGAISRFENSPKSQHRAKKIICLSENFFMMNASFLGSVSVLSNIGKQSWTAAARDGGRESGAVCVKFHI